MFHQGSFRSKNFGTDRTRELTHLFLVMFFPCNWSLETCSNMLSFLLLTWETLVSLHWLLTHFTVDGILLVNAVEVSPQIVLCIVGLLTNVTVIEALSGDGIMAVSFVIPQPIHCVVLSTYLNSKIEYYKLCLINNLHLSNS